MRQPRILMCPPDYYGIEYEINAWMSRARGSQLEVARQQWLDLRDSEAFQLDHSDKKDSKFGTVGAVACDVHGNLAAATSTGGMTNKLPGRVGDSPLLGAGNYCDNDVGTGGLGRSDQLGTVEVTAHAVQVHPEIGLAGNEDHVETVLQAGRREKALVPA